jgi:hypothetical protein
MTSEEKQLLLKELSARSSYGVICQFIWTYSNETTDGKDVIAKEDDNIRCISIHSKEVQADYYDEWVDLEHCKPYLRPMSSMTNEEKEELSRLLPKDWSVDIDKFNNFYFNMCSSIFIEIDILLRIIDWLNAHYFDFHGLISMGLAIEAPEGMYKNKDIIYEM